MNRESKRLLLQRQLRRWIRGQGMPETDRKYTIAELQEIRRLIAQLHY